jgi:hypothetical protein
MHFAIFDAAVSTHRYVLVKPQTRRDGRITGVTSSQPDPFGPDRFGTGELRRRVLDAWAASPARFREDANAEEDYALGGYRDRVVVELAQNAADAAARQGVPGHLRLTLRDGVLRAANTGAPLDAAGVEALSTLRASSKRESDTVGRFGVGFAATVAVSDEPSISTQAGGGAVAAVRWSRAEVAALVRDIPGLADEIAARDGNVPVLRLPFAAEVASTDVASPPAGFVTEVTLPLRDGAAEQLVRRLLDETGPALLLALPALARVEIDMKGEGEVGGDTRTLTAAHAEDTITITSGGITSTWRTGAASGELDLALLAGRPAEERSRPVWSIRWAVPVTPDGEPASLDGVESVVHAPTPTDEPLGLPALLIASFPLSPDRRHVAPGALTGFLVGQAADTYAGLLLTLTPGSSLLNLVPGPVARGELDGQLRRAIVARLPDVPFLPAAGDGTVNIRPRDAVHLEAALPGLTSLLASVIGGLITGPARHPAYAILGVRRLRLADLADLLAELNRDPSWWRQLYQALAAAGSEQLPELGALPVPLADGRLVRGPRGLLLPAPGLQNAADLSILGLRVVHPDAAHPLLTRLGAIEATPRGILADPGVRAAVTQSLDADDPGPVAEAVLSLVAQARPLPGEYPWLADLALPGTDGDWYPAGELLLPGGPLAGVVAADSPFGIVDKETLGRFGEATLEAAGVLSTFALLTAEDVALDDPNLDLDGVDEWAEGLAERVPEGLAVAAVIAVRDLELVDTDRWSRALDLLSVPPLRAAVTEAARVLRSDGRYVDIPSYTAWWLRRHLAVDGMRAASSDPLLAGLYDEADLPVDEEFARALGVRTSLAALLAEPGGADELLDRLADPGRPVTRSQLRALWIALGDAGAVTSPDRVRVIRGEQVVVADAGDALILDAPDLWPLLAERPLVIAPYTLAPRLADLLDLPLVSEEVPGIVESAPELRKVPSALHAILPDAPGEYFAHERLVVDGIAVPWRYVDNAVHADGTDGLARALAWAAGQWPARHLLAAILSDPASAGRLRAESDLDP